MLGYNKTVKLWLIEFFVGLFIHIIYAFNAVSVDSARLVLVLTIIPFVVATLSALIIKNEHIVYVLLFASLFFAVTAVGILLSTIAYSIFVYLIAALMTLSFAKPKVVAGYGISSTIILISYGILLKDIILILIPSLTFYYCLVIIYIISVVNLYYVTRYISSYIEDIKIKTEEAEFAGESKMRFLSNMSHEIRTPMNAIYGMAELSLRDENLPSVVREYIENIKKASRVLISIVNDILDYSKMETGKLDIVPVTYSFRKLCDDVVNMVRIRMEDKNVEIRTEIETDLPDILIGDEMRIRQIIFNLLSNALKNTEKGYIVLKVKGETVNNFLNLTVSVIDSGIGIKKEDIGKIFNSFQQVDSRRTFNREGTGLGLAIVKELLNMMGGTVTVESTYGVGSNFTFTLSQQISQDKAFIQYSKDTAGKNIVNKIVAPDAKVLVVDDNQVNLKVAKGLLKTFELTVDTCMSGRECVDILKTNKTYDIIFIDHMMPELDGIDTLNLIRSDSSDYMKKVPLVVLTANVATGIREMFISEGFDEYVAKPIDMVWLNSVLSKLLPKDKIR